MATPNLQLKGGNFQNGSGTAAAGGSLLFQLSHDEQYTTGPSQVVAGQKFTVTLDGSGNIPISPAFKVYSNDTLLPSGSFYYVRLFDSSGGEVWAAPQFWALTASPNPLDVGSIIPSNPPGAGLSGSTTVVNANVARQIWVIGDGHNTAPLTEGATSAASVSAGNASNTADTATNPGALHVDFSGASGGQVAVGVTGPAAASNGIYTWGTLNYLWHRVRANTPTSNRYWIGGSFAKASGATLVSDTPNNKFIGFRYSDSTDTHWKAVASTSSSNITIVDTGVTVDTTNPQTFQVVAPPSGGTAYSFFINSNLVATISTNTPSTGDLFTSVVSGDQKGGTQDVNFDFWWSVQTVVPSL
jgi:hypothetical protein